MKTQKLNFILMFDTRKRQQNREGTFQGEDHINKKGNKATKIKKGERDSPIFLLKFLCK